MQTKSHRLGWKVIYDIKKMIIIFIGIKQTKNKVRVISYNCREILTIHDIALVTF